MKRSLFWVLLLTALIFGYFAGQMSFLLSKREGKGGGAAVAFATATRKKRQVTGRGEGAAPQKASTPSVGSVDLLVATNSSVVDATSISFDSKMLLENLDEGAADAAEEDGGLAKVLVAHHEHFITQEELVAFTLQENASFPKKKMYQTPPSPAYSCLDVPDPDSLWKVNYPHKARRKSEVTPLELLELLNGSKWSKSKKDRSTADNQEQFDTFVSAEEVDNPHSPVRKPIVFPPPISFSDPVAYNMSQRFGLWKTRFRHVEGMHEIGWEQHALASIAKDRALKEMHYPQLLLPQVPMFYTVFKQGAWMTDGNVITCKRAYTTGGCMWEYKLNKAPIGPNPDYNPPTDVVVALCDDWCNGYFHFTHEHLPRVALIQHILKANPFARITVPPKNGFVIQYMTEVFGFNKSQLVNYRTTRYADQVVYPQPQRCGSIFTSTLYLLRKIVFANLNLTDGVSLVRKSGSSNSKNGRPLLVVLAERKKLSRMPRNYYEIMEQVKAEYESRGVEFVSTTGKSVVEQIKLFYRADLVIGPHGANLSNILWMKHGAYVVEFMSYPYANMCYYGTAARLGLKFGAMFHGASKGGAYNFSVGEIKKHIEYALFK